MMSDNTSGIEPNGLAHPVSKYQIALFIYIFLLPSWGKVHPSFVQGMDFM
jgi:hypothetical protein